MGCVGGGTAGIKGCSGNTGPTGYKASCASDWNKSPFGTSASDAVTYSYATRYTGGFIRNLDVQQLEGLINQERNRRGAGTINVTSSPDDLMPASDWNILINGLNAVYASGIATVAFTDIIDVDTVNALGNKVKEAGNICLCNCNYCACNCNACTCNCNYGCTCNCNYAYSDETLKTDIVFI